MHCAFPNVLHQINNFPSNFQSHLYVLSRSVKSKDEVRRGGEAFCLLPAIYRDVYLVYTLDTIGICNIALLGVSIPFSAPSLSPGKHCNVQREMCRQRLGQREPWWAIPSVCAVCVSCRVGIYTISYSTHQPKEEKVNPPIGWTRREKPVGVECF